MRIYLTIILTALAFSLFGQNYVFEKIKTDNGLSQNDINAIYQDRNGFMWFGTNDGLNRYDGYSFKIFRVDPHAPDGISSNLVFNICEDDDGNLWMATSDEGICKFNLKTEEFTLLRNTELNPYYLSSNRVKKVIAAKDGSIWALTNKGVDVVHVEKDGFKIDQLNTLNTPELLDNGVLEIAEGPYGRIWVGNKQGLFVAEYENNKYRFKSIFRNSSIGSVLFADGKLLIANNYDVLLYEFDYEALKAGKLLKDYRGYSANNLHIDRYNNLFFGSNDGLYLVRNLFSNEKTEPLHFVEGWEENSLSKNVITSIFEDNSGIIWIGTNGGGVNKYNPKRKNFKHYSKTRIKGSLSYDKIRSIYEDRGGNIWIGTEGGGISMLPFSDRGNYESGFKYLNVNPANAQNTAYSFVEMNEDGPIDLLLGTGYPKVVNRIKENNGEWEIVNDETFDNVENAPFTILKDNRNDIWLGTYGNFGIYRYSKTEEGWKSFNYRANDEPGSLTSNIIRSLFQDDLGNIWIGTDNGLNLLTKEQLNKRQPVFISFKHQQNNPSSISHNYILPIYQQTNKTLWVGTMGGGINKVNYHHNPDSITFTSITTNEGMPNNVIKGILEDDYGYLWISSNKGLTRYDTRDHLIENYDITDGLQDYEFGELACCKLKNGELIFGGVNGFNVFDPKDIVRDRSTPEIGFTDFQILNQSIAAGEKMNGRVVLENVINHTDNIKLKHGENSFAIYFSSLHFSAPGKNMYKYKLEGFDEDWIRKDATERFAKYTNLRSGTYVFRVLASNNDGIWSNNERIIKIVITPPWWMSMIAWLFYFALFFVLIWFFQRYSFIRNQRKNELVMEHFEKEKVQELSQMKLRFFTNISHEFRTPLTLIIGPLEKLIKQGDQMSDTKRNDSYAIMHRNASILLRLINQLIDFRKMEQGKMKLRASNTNVVSFLKGVFQSFCELADNKRISYNFVRNRSEIDVWFDDDKLERIMYNLLSNAFKFTPEEGQIDLVIDEDDYHVVIEVVDNGVGIPKDMQKHIFERFYQADRIKNRKGASTGIGLSFIKGLVEMHSGEISFESIEDQGTTFVVKLKKGNVHLSDEQMRDVSRGEVEQRNFNFLEPNKNYVDEDDINTNKSKPNVVIVEDNFELRQFIKDSLKHEYQVYLAENGKEGLDKVIELNPDIIVSDIMMPIMNGFQLCENVKSNENISHIPVVLLTAKSSAETRIKGYKMGADGYISKPFNIEVLEARIKNLIESREKLREKLRTTISVEPSEVTTTSMDEKFLNRVLSIIEDNISNSDFTVEQLASDYGMTQIILNRKLKALTGMTAKAFIRSMRLKRAAQLFATGKYSVTDITYEVGFSDLKYFRTCFKDEFGLSPSEYIKKHKEENAE